MTTPVWLTEIISDPARSSAIKARLVASPKSATGHYCMYRPEDAEAAMGLPYAKLRECVPHIQISNSKRMSRMRPEDLLMLVTHGTSWTFIDMISGESSLHAKEGSVYFAEAVGCDRIKIGFTGGPVADRIAKLQTSCPFVIETYGSVRGSAALEAGLHLAFGGVRVMPNAEWFHMKEDLMTTIDTLIAHDAILARPEGAT